MPNSISRRSTLGLLGAGALAGALLARVETAEAAEVALGAGELLAPLKVGSAFARWTVAAIHPLSDGAIVMAVRECTRQRQLAIAQAEQYGDVSLDFRPEDQRAIATGDRGAPDQLPKRQRRPPLVTWTPAALRSDAAKTT